MKKKFIRKKSFKVMDSINDTEKGHCGTLSDIFSYYKSKTQPETVESFMPHEVSSNELQDMPSISSDIVQVLGKVRKRCKTTRGKALQELLILVESFVFTKDNASWITELVRIYSCDALCDADPRLRASFHNVFLSVFEKLGNQSVDYVSTTLPTVWCCTCDLDPKVSSEAQKVLSCFTSYVSNASQTLALIEIYRSELLEFLSNLLKSTKESFYENYFIKERPSSYGEAETERYEEVIAVALLSVSRLIELLRLNDLKLVEWTPYFQVFFSTDLCLDRFLNASEFSVLVRTYAASLIWKLCEAYYQNKMKNPHCKTEIPFQTTAVRRCFTNCCLKIFQPRNADILDAACLLFIHFVKLYPDCLYRHDNQKKTKPVENEIPPLVSCGAIFSSLLELIRHRGYATVSFQDVGFYKHFPVIVGLFPDTVLYSAPGVSFLRSVLAFLLATFHDSKDSKHNRMVTSSFPCVLHCFYDTMCLVLEESNIDSSDFLKKLQHEIVHLWFWLPLELHIRVLRSSASLNDPIINLTERLQQSGCTDNRLASMTLLLSFRHIEKENLMKLFEWVLKAVVKGRIVHYALELTQRMNDILRHDILEWYMTSANELNPSILKSLCGLIKLLSSIQRQQLPDNDASCITSTILQRTLHAQFHYLSIWPEDLEGHLDTYAFGLLLCILETAHPECYRDIQWNTVLVSPVTKDNTSFSLVNLVVQQSIGCAFRRIKKVISSCADGNAFSFELFPPICAPLLVSFVKMVMKIFNTQNDDTARLEMSHIGSVCEGDDMFESDAVMKASQICLWLLFFGVLSCDADYEVEEMEGIEVVQKGNWIWRQYLDQFLLNASYTKSSLFSTFESVLFEGILPHIIRRCSSLSEHIVETCEKMLNVFLLSNELESCLRNDLIENFMYAVYRYMVDDTCAKKVSVVKNLAECLFQIHLMRVDYTKNEDSFEFGSEQCVEQFMDYRMQALLARWKEANEEQCEADCFNKDALGAKQLRRETVNLKARLNQDGFIGFCYRKALIFLYEHDALAAEDIVKKNCVCLYTTAIRPEKKEKDVMVWIGSCTLLFDSVHNMPIMDAYSLLGKAAQFWSCIDLFFRALPIGVSQMLYTLLDVEQGALKIIGLSGHLAAYIDWYAATNDITLEELLDFPFHDFSLPKDQTRLTIFSHSFDAVYRYIILVWTSFIFVRQLGDFCCFDDPLSASAVIRSSLTNAYNAVLGSYLNAKEAFSNGSFTAVRRRIISLMSFFFKQCIIKVPWNPSHECLVAFMFSRFFSIFLSTQDHSIYSFTDSLSATLYEAWATLLPLIIDEDVRQGTDNGNVDSQKSHIERCTNLWSTSLCFDGKPDKEGIELKFMHECCDESATETLKTNTFVDFARDGQWSENITGKDLNCFEHGKVEKILMKNMEVAQKQCYPLVSLVLRTSCEWIAAQAGKRNEHTTNTSKRKSINYTQIMTTVNVEQEEESKGGIASNVIKTVDGVSECHEDREEMSQGRSLTLKLSEQLAANIAWGLSCLSNDSMEDNEAMTANLRSVDVNLRAFTCVSALHQEILYDDTLMERMLLVVERLMYPCSACGEEELKRLTWRHDLFCFLESVMHCLCCPRLLDGQMGLHNSSVFSSSLLVLSHMFKLHTHWLRLELLGSNPVCLSRCIDCFTACVSRFFDETAKNQDVLFQSIFATFEHVLSNIEAILSYSWSCFFLPGHIDEWIVSITKMFHSIHRFSDILIGPALSPYYDLPGAAKRAEVCAFSLSRLCYIVARGALNWGTLPQLQKSLWSLLYSIPYPWWTVPLLSGSERKSTLMITNDEDSQHQEVCEPQTLSHGVTFIETLSPWLREHCLKTILTPYVLRSEDAGEDEKQSLKNGMFTLYKCFSVYLGQDVAQELVALPSLLTQSLVQIATQKVDGAGALTWKKLKQHLSTWLMLLRDVQRHLLESDKSLNEAVSAHLLLDVPFSHLHMAPEWHQELDNKLRDSSYLHWPLQLEPDQVFPFFDPALGNLKMESPTSLLHALVDFVSLIVCAEESIRLAFPSRLPNGSPHGSTALERKCSQISNVCDSLNTMFSNWPLSNMRVANQLGLGETDSERCAAHPRSGLDGAEMLAKLWDSAAPQYLDHVAVNYSDYPDSWHTVWLMAVQLCYILSAVFPCALRLYVSPQQSIWMTPKHVRGMNLLFENIISPCLLLRDIASLSQITRDESCDGVTMSQFHQRTRELRLHFGNKTNEVSLDIVVVFPTNYPLRCVSLKYSQSVGISQSKVEKWLLASKYILLGGVLSRKNDTVDEQSQVFNSLQDSRIFSTSVYNDANSCSIVTCLTFFKQNVAKFLSGLEDCSICYCIVHPRTRSLPKRKCATCRNKFHGECLDRYLVVHALSRVRRLLAVSYSLYFKRNSTLWTCMYPSHYVRLLVWFYTVN